MQFSQPAVERMKITILIYSTVSLQSIRPFGLDREYLHLHNLRYVRASLQSATYANLNLHKFFGWYSAAHSMACVIREMSRQLWRPNVEAEGIPFQILVRLVRPLHQWRDDFLVHVGVPSNFQADWDFVAAVSACTSDAQYHVMWVILQNAVEEFGIREVNESNQEPTSPVLLQIEELRSTIAKEAIHGAVRIAGLASNSIRLFEKFN